MEIVEKAYAKLNLTLDITGKVDKYHTLDMLVASINLYDLVTVRSRNDNKIVAYMDGVLCDEKNSAVRAANILRNEFNVGGFDIFIEKHIPIGGGLGGSTADGVAVVRAIQKMEKIPEDKITNELLITIGSDAPCMYKNGVKRVRGIGEKIDFIDIKIPYKVGIIAGSGVDTTAAYKAFDLDGKSGNCYTETLLSNTQTNDFDIAKFLGNDLYSVSKNINPNIEIAVETMISLGAKGVSMSGSGSAVFGLFSDDVPKNLIEAEFIY